MKNFYSFKLTYLILVLLAVLNCSQYRMATVLRSNNLRAYDGPYLPKDKVGYLSKTSEARAIQIAKVDGRAIEEIKDEKDYTGEPGFIELLPGEHIIKVTGRTDSGRALPFSEVSWWTVSVEGEWMLRFSVEPGQVYLIDLKIGKAIDVSRNRYAPSYYKISTVFIKEKKTKKIVSQAVEDK